MEEQLSEIQSQGVPIEKKSTSKRRIFISILVLVLIFLGGLTGVLATRIWDPLWNPFRPVPEKVIERMVLETEKVKTSQGKTELSLIASNDGKLDLRLNSEGKVDKTQPEKPKYESTFNLVASLTEKETPIGLGMKFALAGEMKGINETAYLKLTTLPAVPFLGMLGIDFSQFEDQWIKIDQESITDLMKKMGGEMWTPEMERMYKEQTEKQKVIQKQLQEEMKKVLMEKKFYLVKRELPDEKIDGVKVYHYLLSLNNEELLTAIPEIWKIIEGTMLKEYGTAPTFDEKQFREKLKEFLDKVGEIDGEIWIGKKDYLLYRIKGEKSFDLIKFGEKGTVSINLNLENSKFNQPVKIEAPSEYKDLGEILTPLFGQYGGLLGGAQLRAIDARIMADMSQVRMVAELLYSDENSYRNLCRNSTLNENHSNYGDVLATAEKDIKENQGGILNLSCYSSKESYCVVADLVSPDEGKYCIDSSGRAGEISENLTCLGNGTSKIPYCCPEEKSPSEEMKLPMKESPSLFQASIIESFLRLFKK